MTPKIKVNWIKVEEDYRSNQISIREIGRRYGIAYQSVQKYAKRHGWTRDLGVDVQKKLAEKVIKEDAGAVSPFVNDEEIVDLASERALQIIKLQRKDLSRVFEIIRVLMTELESNPKESKKSGIIRDLAQAYAKLIPLMRQAYNIDPRPSAGSKDDPIHVRHSMDTDSLRKAVGLPKGVTGNIVDVSGSKIPRLTDGKQDG